jgi:hypothetical protein
MNQFARGALLVLALGACTSDEAPSGDPSRGDSPPSSNVAMVESSTNPSTSTASQSGFSGNVVNSGGSVIVNLGPFKDLRSADPLQHIYQRGLPGVSTDRVSLGATILDLLAGITLKFEFDYTNELTAIDLMEHGFLLLEQGGARRLATAGFVTVSQESPGRMKLSFSKLELGDEATINAGNVPVAEPIADGSVVGDVQRFCMQPPGSASPFDSSNPFCSMP